MDLERLHSILEGDGNNWDKLACGSFLFCVYAGARWSDFTHGERITLDRFSHGRIAYAEMDVTIHKTIQIPEPGCTADWRSWRRLGECLVTMHDHIEH